MMIRYDVVVAGGGPAGSAAAWQAVRNGARVLLCDKAEFPRDKPCGNGLTPRAVSYLQKMGLGDEVEVEIDVEVPKPPKKAEIKVEKA